MAKKGVLRYFVPESDLDLPSTALIVTDVDRKSVTYTDLFTGTEMTLGFTGLKFALGFFYRGTLESLTVVNGEGEKLLAISGLHITEKSFQFLGQDTFPNPVTLFDDIMGFGISLKANIIIGSKGADILNGGIRGDTIKGGGGADEIDGSAGNDILSGGAGADIFHFDGGLGKDKILDFDADGSDGAQDLISADDTLLIDKKTVHGNAVLNFGNGDTLTLIGVNANHIDATDFM